MLHGNSVVFFMIQTSVPPGATISRSVSKAGSAAAFLTAYIVAFTLSRSGCEIGSFIPSSCFSASRQNFSAAAWVSGSDTATDYRFDNAGHSLAINNGAGWLDLPLRLMLNLQWLKLRQ